MNHGVKDCLFQGDAGVQTVLRRHPVEQFDRGQKPLNDASCLQAVIVDANGERMLADACGIAASVFLLDPSRRHLCLPAGRGLECAGDGPLE